MIKISEEQKNKIKDAIHEYYVYERGEDIGIIHQDGLLDLLIT